MLRRFLPALAVCFAMTASTWSAEDFSQQVRDRFPGKWEAKTADGKVFLTVEYKLVAGGKAILAKGVMGDGVEFSALGGWNPIEKKWVSLNLGADGRFIRFELTKFEKDSFSGTAYMIDGSGKLITGETRNRFVDADHMEVTQILNGEERVLNCVRKKD